MIPFGLLVIDEAVQLKECETLIPLQLPGIQYAVLIGDEHQLLATIISKVSEEVEFGISMFERLVSLGHKKHLLNVQYRMHPSISLFLNTEFYNKQISYAPNVNESTYKRHILQGNMFGCLSFINAANGKETLINNGSVWKKLVIDTKYRGCFFNANDDEGLSNEIINSMIELDQLDDFLNGDLLFKGVRWKLLMESQLKMTSWPLYIDKKGLSITKDICSGKGLSTTKAGGPLRHNSFSDPEPEYRGYPKINSRGLDLRRFEPLVDDDDVPQSNDSFETIRTDVPPSNELSIPE
ncbi:hypothetical protein GIB67_011301 [Kingdonia uniflora]|uniref:Uncharacterized protein n=1 Tax=Kingdonia uniflora TaxID=39325 RepID=A0A7J7MNY6_9MAGN|nr:hypothetical protein GIB67_011301 [Kingdonia uniflora]